MADNGVELTGVEVDGVDVKGAEMDDVESDTAAIFNGAAVCVLDIVLGRGMTLLGSADMSRAGGRDEHAIVLSSIAPRAHVMSAKKVDRCYQSDVVILMVHRADFVGC